MNAFQEAGAYQQETKTLGEVPVASLARVLFSPDGRRILDANILGTMQDLGLGGIPVTLSGTLSKAVAATGSIVFSGGVPTDGQIVTIAGTVFEADDGEYATATITYSGVPSDTGTVTISDGTTTKVFEHDTGILGVASTGGVFTFTTAAPVDGDTITLTTSTPAGSSAKIIEFNSGGGVTSGNFFCATGTTAANAATEMIACINGTGIYAGNGLSAFFTAASGGSGVVNISRVATGAGNETITKSFATGANGTVTANFSGGITQVAVGSAITGGRVGVGTASTPGGSALTTAEVVTNMINAINAVTGPAFLFTASQGAGTTVTLTANAKGTAGNAFTLTESSSNLAVTDFTTSDTGEDPGDGAIDAESDFAFAIGTTAALTATALFNAINTAAINITATNDVAGTVALVVDEAGEAGNDTITSDLSHATVSGLSGGAQATTLTLLAASEITGYTFYPTGFVAKVAGADAWDNATDLFISTDSSVGENPFLTITGSALTASALVAMGTTGVDVTEGWFQGIAPLLGIYVVPQANEQDGSDILFQLSGVLKPTA